MVKITDNPYLAGTVNHAMRNERRRLPTLHMIWPVSTWKRCMMERGDAEEKKRPC